MKKSIVFLMILLLTQNMEWFLLDRDMNQVVLITISLGALCFVFVRKYDISTFYWFAMYLVMITIGLFNKNTFRITTIVYSGAFIFCFMFFRYMIKENWITTNDYYEILCFFIYLLVGIQFVQQIGYILGIRTINAMRTAYASERICFCSITSEPAHYSRVLFIFSYSLELIRRLLNKELNTKKTLFTRICIFWGFATIGSVTGLISYLLLLILLLKNSMNIIFGCILSLLFINSIEILSDISVITRANKFISGILTFNSDILLENEHSGGVRIAPIIIFFNDASFLDILWGKGIDASIELYYGKIMGVDMEDQRGGIFPNHLYNYGLLAFVLFLLAIKHNCIRNKSYRDWIVFVYVITVCPFNFQYTWLTFMLLATNKHMFEKEEKRLANVFETEQTEKEISITTAEAPSITQ